MSNFLNVDRKTLYRYRRQMGNLEVRSCDISDEDLDQIISDSIRDTPNAGEVYIMGQLRAQNLRIPRRRLRERLNILDPIGRGTRRRTALKRREYKVKSPNSLWYL